MEVKTITWKEVGQNTLTGFVTEIRCFSIHFNDDGNECYLWNALPHHANYLFRPTIASCKDEAQQLLKSFAELIIQESP